MLGAVQGANMVPLYLMARAALRVDARPADIKLMAGALALLGQVGALTLTEFGTTYYDNVMSVFVLAGLAILVCNREALRDGPLRQGGGTVGASPGLLTGMAMGLKLPEMPFCVGFAAALVALGGSWKQQLVRLIAGGIGGRDRLCDLQRAVDAVHVASDRQSAVSLFQRILEVAAGAGGALSRPALCAALPLLARSSSFPSCSPIDWHVADDLGFQDIRVMRGLSAGDRGRRWCGWCRRESRDPLLDKRVTADAVRLFGAVLFRLAANSSPSIATSSCWRCWRRC